MSTVIAAVVIDNRVIHCVDYDRPVWMSPGNGQGFVPDLDHFLVDGLIAWASPLFGLESFSSSRCGLSERQFPNSAAAPRELTEARNAVYASKDHWLLCVFWGGRDKFIVNDIAKLGMRFSVADADPASEPSWP